MTPLKLGKPEAPRALSTCAYCENVASVALHLTDTAPLVDLCAEHADALQRSAHLGWLRPAIRRARESVAHLPADCSSGKAARTRLNRLLGELADLGEAE
jgi:hypothetical protein